MQFAGANEVVARARASVAVRGLPLNFKQKQFFFLFACNIFFKQTVKSETQHSLEQTYQSPHLSERVTDR